MAASSNLIEAIDTGVRQRGFDDVRPAHGFAFARMASGGTTVSELAGHLGVTRQAAGQLVDELVAKGYARRTPHPDDARSRMIILTDRGWACTRAAEAAATDAVRRWADVLGADEVRRLADALARVTPPGPLRPVW